MDSVILNIILAILPGTIWLFYFLKKDNRPEPNRQIIKVFILGFLASIPAALVELVMMGWLSGFSLPEKTAYFLKYIFIIGMIEELFKYFVVRYGILNTSEIDEPIDIPLYMIIAALGFATAENVLVFLTQTSPLLYDHLLLSFTRFIGATLLHALCSGIIGYAIAIAWCGRKKWYVPKILLGVSAAIGIHGLFDFFLESSIIKAMENGWGSSALYSVIIIIALFWFLSKGLNKIRKLKGACKI